MTSPLTPDAISKILSGQKVEKPVLQILAHKKVPADVGNQDTRYRFIMSDGSLTHQCCIMVGDQLIRRVENGEFEKFTILQLNDYICNNVKENRVIVMNSMVVIKPGAEVGRKIGDPKNTKQQNQNPNVVGGMGAPKGPMSSPASKRPMPRGAEQMDMSSPKRVNTQSIVPISALNPFNNRWTIKGRVTSKSSIRTWNKPTGSGKLFSFEIRDESGEIKCTAFNQEVDRYIDMIELDKVYVISRGTIKTAWQKFGKSNHEYELSFGSETVVEQGDDQDSQCPKMNFNFVRLQDISNMEPDTLIDVAAICRKVGDVATFISKSSQKELKKRDVVLVDESEAEISLSVWGEEAANFSANVGSAILLMKAKVSSYNGRTLTTGGSCSIMIDPSDNPTTEHLKEWYETVKEDLNPVQLSVNSFVPGETPIKLLGEAYEEVLNGSGDKPIFFQCKVSIGQMNRTSTYQACPTESCNKKVVDMNNGFYRCEKCNQDFDNSKTRYIQSVSMADVSRDMWSSTFHNESLTLLDLKEEDIPSLKEDPTKWDEHLATRNFQTYMVKVKMAREVYKEEQKIRANIMALNPVDYVAYTRKLLEVIKFQSENR